MHIDRKDLEAEREWLLTRLLAVETLLQDEPNRQPSRIQRQQPARTGKRSGLRPAIRDVLAKHPSGLRPTEVTAALRDRSFTLPDTKTSITVRVSNELWRMAVAKDDPVRRTKAGKYKLVKTDGRD